MTNLPVSASAIALAAALALLGVAPSTEASGAPTLDVGFRLDQSGLTVRLPFVVLTSSR